MEAAEVVEMDSTGATAGLLILATVINHGPGLLAGIGIDIEVLQSQVGWE